MYLQSALNDQKWHTNALITIECRVVEWHLEYMLMYNMNLPILYVNVIQLLSIKCQWCIDHQIKILYLLFMILQLSF